METTLDVSTYKGSTTWEINFFWKENYSKTMKIYLVATLVFQTNVSFFPMSLV